MAVAGDDDAAAFKNVPRPRKDEELGADDDPGRGGSSGAPPPPPHVGRAEKRRRLLRAEDSKNGGAPPATAAASEWAENERIRKGKMSAAAVDASPAGSGGGKLMGDAIRCHGGSKNNKKKKPKTKKRKGLGLGPPFWYGMGRDGQSTSTAGSGEDHSFSNLPPAVVSAGLRAALPGGAAPVRVYGRLMSGSDRNTHQSRLQMSCKSWRAAEDGEYPVCAFLTESERAAAQGEGLVLKAYDRRGREYDLKLRYLACNSSYRLISKWGDLLRMNGLVVDKGGGGDAEPVMLELWLFRPPGGKVGMVVLHYYKGDAKHADAALEEQEGRRRATKSRRLADDAYYSTAAEGMEDGVNGKKGEGYDYDGVKGEAAAAPSPAEELDDGTKAEAGSAPVEAAAPSSSDAAGGAAKVVVEEEGGAPPDEADGTKAVEEKEASAAPVEAAAAQSASPASGAGGAAKSVGKEAAPPPPPPLADEAGGAKKAASKFGLTSYEWLAALALVQLSQS